MTSTNSSPPRRTRDVELPRQRANAVGKATEDDIADGVAVRVVDLLEIVQVEQQEARPGVAVPILHRGPKMRSQLAGAERQREVVRHREPLQARTLQRRHRAVGEKLRRQLVPLVERPDPRR
jgi:hypothetical protein